MPVQRAEAARVQSGIEAAEMLLRAFFADAQIKIILVREIGFLCVPLQVILWCEVRYPEIALFPESQWL